MSANYQIDTKGLALIGIKLRKLPKEIPAATSSAMNRALDHAYTVAGKVIPKEYAITAARVKKTLRKYRASKTKLSARLRSTGGSLTLGSFPHKPETVIISRALGVKHEKAQVKVKVKRNSAMKAPATNPKVFLQKASNATNIFKREGKSRFPINVVHTLSIPQMLGQEKVMSSIQEQSNKKLQERINHEIEYRLNKAAGRFK